MRDLVRGNVIVGSTQTKHWPAGRNLVGFTQLRLVFHCFDHRGSALVAELAFWWIRANLQHRLICKFKNHGDFPLKVLQKFLPFKMRPKSDKNDI